MANINRSNITPLLRPGAHAVWEHYNIYPQFWHNIYTRHRSDKAVEYEYQTLSLPTAQLVAEGSSIPLGSMRTMFTSSYVMQKYGMGFSITSEAIDDNQYDKDFPLGTLALQNSMQTQKNYNAAAIFNNASDVLFPLSDGQPFASEVHPTQSGTLSNTLVGVDLNESSLEDAIVLMKGWTNLAGLPINMMPKTLLVPQGLAFAASRMLKSAYRVNTPNNDVNAIVEDKYIPGGYMVCNYLTDPTNWFLLTDEPNGLKFFMRSPVELDFIEDTFTQTVTSVAYERYAFGTSTWMAAVIGQGI